MRAWLCVVLVLYNINWTQQQAEDDDDYGVSKPLTQTFTYGGMDYMFFSERVTWEEAKVICPSYQARLAVIKDLLVAKFLASLWAASDMAHLHAMWIGGRKEMGTNWTWITGDQVAPNVNWPEWKRTGFREGKDCMALMRYHHQDVVVADLSCGLVKPFMCEKSSALLSSDPIPTYWVSYKGVQYVLYNGHLNWYKAVAYCRIHGQRIAKFLDSTIGKVLKGAMTKSRPSLEMVWIGGHSVEGKWIWVIDGSDIDTTKNQMTNYIQWLHEDEHSKGGCLAFDKHNRQAGQFIRALCDRKRSFVCEDLNSLTNEEFRGKNLQFPCAPFTCVLVDIKSSWYKAKSYCEVHFKQDLVTLVDHTQSQFISDAMADHPNEIRHAWIGGHRLPDGTWTWVDNSTIPTTRQGPDNENPFPAWCPVDVLNLSFDLDLCLNFDRTDYTEYAIYGLPCNDTQAFVCVTDPKADHDQNPEHRAKKRSVQEEWDYEEPEMQQEFAERHEGGENEEEEEEEEEEIEQIKYNASRHEEKKKDTKMLNLEDTMVLDVFMQPEERMDGRKYMTQKTTEKEYIVTQQEETTENGKPIIQETNKQEGNFTQRKKTIENGKRVMQETTEKRENITEQREATEKGQQMMQETFGKGRNINQQEETTGKRGAAEKEEKITNQAERTEKGIHVMEETTEKEEKRMQQQVIAKREKRNNPPETIERGDNITPDAETMETGQYITLGIRENGENMPRGTAEQLDKMTLQKEIANGVEDSTQHEEIREEVEQMKQKEEKVDDIEYYEQEEEKIHDVKDSAQQEEKVDDIEYFEQEPEKVDDIEYYA